MRQSRQYTLTLLFGIMLGAVGLAMLTTSTMAAEATIDHPAPTVLVASIACEDTDGNIACYYGDDTGANGTMVITFYPYGADTMGQEGANPRPVITLDCVTDTVCLVEYEL